MSRGIIYTSVFGNYDNIVEQKLPDGWDWKYFSENNSLPLYTDNTRNAKRFKVLPHRYLSEYDYSIFIDGNMTVNGDVNELVDKYLNDSNVAFFSHSDNSLDGRNCIYDEANTIFELGEKNMKIQLFSLSGLWCGLQKFLWPFSIFLRSLMPKKCSGMQNSCF